MPLFDDQIALLGTARDALHAWQTTAQGAGITLQQVTLVFPTEEGGAPRTVTFTWRPASDPEGFDIST